MNYELAKKLKHARYPIKEIVVSEDHVLALEYYKLFNLIQVGHVLWVLPTLSELIEACGVDGFAYLENHQNIQWRKTVGGNPDLSLSWAAQGNGFRGSGSTPEEAIANLWLSLNKKHD